MPLKCAMIGVSPVQQDLLQAVAQLAESGAITVVAAGHESPALARDLGDRFQTAAFDDMRQLLVTVEPDIVILERQENVTLDFVQRLIADKIGVFSIGPLVASLAEAQTLAGMLETRTHLLYIWPCTACDALFRNMLSGDQLIRPLRFGAGQWLAPNHAVARALEQQTHDSVRSLLVLAWDALRTVIELFGMPESLYAVLSGAAPNPGGFADITGDATISLRLPEEALCSLALSDRDAQRQRQLTLWGQRGALQWSDSGYRVLDGAGHCAEEKRVTPASAARQAQDHVVEFIQQFQAPASPARGWRHYLEETAASVEAMLVSNRTGQSESPERLRKLRR